MRLVVGAGDFHQLRLQAVDGSVVGRFQHVGETFQLENVTIGAFNNRRRQNDGRGGLLKVILNIVRLNDDWNN
jgi:hypothetical protein